MAPGELIAFDLDRATLAGSGRREGREIRLLCPAHEDTHPSARWHSTKRAWFCDACRTGGRWQDLAERLGLIDQGARRQAGADPDVAAIYSYRDAAGAILFEAVRKRPKAFACRRPDGHGRWIWNLRGIERTLYRLPEVLAAVERGERIFVIEGEKDADALAGLGMAATTNPGGAGKWRACYGEPLRGARVAVIPDQDAAGGAHAEMVAKALRGVAGEVRILELQGMPAKGDVSDWIELRRREGKADAVAARELLFLAAAAPTWEERTAAAGRPALRSTQMSEAQPQEMSFLWRPYLPVGKLMLLEGGTRRVAYAATLVGVELVDHLVLGAIGLWVSIKAQGGASGGKQDLGGRPASAAACQFQGHSGRMAGADERTMRLPSK